MKKIALITLLAIVSLFIVSCRRELTLEEKAEKAVKKYLDKSWNGDFKIIGFKNFTTYKAYSEQDNKAEYERLSKNESEEFRIYIKNELNKTAVENEKKHHKWYKIECTYNPKNFGNSGYNFFISPDFKTVEQEKFAE